MSELICLEVRPLHFAASNLLDQMSTLAVRDWVLIVAVTALAAVLFSFLIYFMFNRRQRQRKEREVVSMVNQFVVERDKSEAILADPRYWHPGLRQRWHIDQ